MPRLIPTGNRIMVRPDPPATIAGIATPETWNDRQRPESGVVVSFGEGAALYPTGTRLAFAQYSGHEIEVDGERFVLLVPSEVLAFQEAADAATD